MPAATDDAIRCEAYDACRAAYARGGPGALQELVADAWVELARLRRLHGLARDTVPCAAPVEVSDEH